MENKAIMKELQMLRQMEQQVKMSLLNKPEGKLRADGSKRKNPQYYWIHEDERQVRPLGSYIRKADREFAVQLAQKEYDEKFFKLIQKQIRLLESFGKGYSLQKLADVYTALPESKQMLIKPYIPTESEFLDNWKAVHPGGQNEIAHKNAYQTECGELVRSKSEKMIADKFWIEKIPYSYEASLLLKGYGMIFPDFTILNRRTRTTLYYEHFGMMDDPEYCKKALEKMEAYELNGIWPGKQLLITMESSKKGIDMQVVEKMIQTYMI